MSIRILDHTDRAELEQQIAALSEEMANVEAELGGFGVETTKLINQLGQAGNFTEASGQWYCTNGGSVSISNNTAVFSAPARYSGIRPYQISSFDLKAGHLLYIWATIKSTNKITMSFNGIWPLPQASTSGTGEYEFISGLKAADQDRAEPIMISDGTETFGAEISVRKVGYIDLTACYGAGNEPDKATMDDLIASNGYWFAEKTISSGEAQGSLRETVEATAKTVNEKLMHKLPDKTVLIFGDSITATNQIAANGALTSVKTNWPTFAMSYLGIANWYNYGKDGSSYHDVDGSADFQTFAKQFAAAKAAGITPDIIIVSLGTNDYQHDNTDTYDQAMAVGSLDALDRKKLNQALRYCYWALTEYYPNAVVYAATPIQRPDTGVFTPMRDAIIKMAQTYNVQVIDAGVESGICKQYETWGAAGRYLSDGLHPNEAGKKKLGAYYAQKILTTYNVID